jgi:hypothetical protein
LRPAEATGWVARHEPAGVAIDSPPRPNRGLLADSEYRARHAIDLRGWGANRRVCDWRLGIGGYYSTPGSREECQPWMLTGMNLFGRFEELGFRTDVGSGGSVFEIHPTYGFRSLVGSTSIGLRVRCARLAPKRRAGSLGHRQRLRLLATLLEQRWHAALHDRSERSLDWTDAMLGAVLAALRSEGGTRQVEAPGEEEGAIVLAASPLAGVAALLERAGQRR